MVVYGDMEKSTGEIGGIVGRFLTRTAVSRVGVFPLNSKMGMRYPFPFILACNDRFQMFTPPRLFRQRHP